MKIGSVANILDEVVTSEKIRHSDPLNALVPHATQTADISNVFGIHEQRHRVATDARADERALGHFGTSIVWTTGTEEGSPRDCHRGTRRVLPGPKRLETIAKLGREPSMQHRHHPIRIERAESGHKHSAELICLPDHAGTTRKTVERILHERFDARAFLFDHQNFR